MTVGERMKKLRKENGLTLEDLAQMLGKNKSTIHRYEKGEIENLPLASLEPIATALKTTPAYLMGWEDDEIETSNEIKKESDDFYDDMESKMSLYLPEEEVEIIKQYRASDETTREIIRKILSITKG